MSNGMLLGFVAISATVVGVLDYTMQSRKADLSFGELGFGAYIATMETRFVGMKAEQSAAAEAGSLRRQEPRTLLPEAPEGWVMREWNEGDRARLFPSREIFREDENKPDEFQAFEEKLMNDPHFRQMAEASERLQVAKEKAEIRFYQRGDSLIALQLDYNREAGGINLNGQIGGDMQNTAMNIVAGNMTAMSGRDGFAVVGGVPFGQQLGLFGLSDPDADPTTTVRSFRGQMGPELKISVRAMAPDQDVKDLLAQIDFDTLNKMLTTPLDGVGSNAPTIALEDEKAIAEAAVEAQAAEVIARGRQSEAELRALGQVVHGGQGDQAAATGGLLGTLFQRTVEARVLEAEEEAAAAAAPPKEGSLAALMAGGAPAVVSEAPIAAAPSGTGMVEAATPVLAPVPAPVPAQEVRIRRAGAMDAENCTMTATGKRCSLIGD